MYTNKQDYEKNIYTYIYIYVYIHICIYIFAYIYTNIHIVIRLDDTKATSYCFFIENIAKKFTKIH